MFQNLHPKEYDIAGNVLRTWYDDEGKLAFVVDETIDEYKPNVLLVVRSDGTRRWDDLLQNVYNIDLELIRPKRDNKYQKLDIEYSGIDVYEDLIGAYENHGDLNAALADLIDFRDAAVRRAATVRLTNANDEIAQAQITMDKTKHAIKSMNDRMRNFRNRLARQKSYVGREPSKQLASKILRTEAHIESTEDKLLRAEKRLENARRRIEIATEDANAALALLALRRPTVDFNMDAADTPHRVVDARAKKNDVAKMPVTDEMDEDVEPELEEPEDTDMPKKSDEVKPLLDKDPEILDDEIAFKPVDFGDIKPAHMPELKRPLSPYAAMDDEPKPETVHDDGDRNDAAFGFPGEGDDEDDSDDDALPRTDIDTDDDDYRATDKKKKDSDDMVSADNVDDNENADDEREYKVRESRYDSDKEDKSVAKMRVDDEEETDDYKYDREEKSDERSAPEEKREETVVDESATESRDEPDDYSVKTVERDVVADDTAKSEFEDNFGHMNFGGYADSAPEFTEKKFDESWGESETQENKANEERAEPVIDTIKTVDESAPTDVDTTGQASTAQYDNQGLSAPERPFSPVEVPKMPIEETRPMSPIQHDEKPRPVGTKRSGIGYYILLILLIALSIFTLWLYQKKNGGTVPFLGLGEKVEVVEPDEPVDLYEEPDVPVQVLPVYDEPEPVSQQPVVVPEPSPADKPIEVRYPNDDILRGPEPDVRVIESEEDVLARKEPYGVSRDDKPILVEVNEPVVETVVETIVEPEPVIEVTTVTAPDVIIEENVVSVPMPAMGEDVETIADYDNPANVEYVTETYLYEQPMPQQYAPEPQYMSEPQYVDQSYDYVAEPEPDSETRRDFSVHDGGQYSVTETVTFIAD